MKRVFVLFTIFFVIAFFSCKENDNEDVVNRNNIESSDNITASGDTLIAQEISDLTPQLPYELKDDGLYVYLDGPAHKEKSGKYCYDYALKNYKYVKVESNKDKIQSAEGPKKYQLCKVSKSCEENLGKPSLFELGYERHGEREIKPEDNRFGKPKKIEKQWFEYERRIREQIKYDYILNDYFTQITTKEFENNGIVIIGKHISRVVIKSIAHLPKYGNKIVVKYEKTLFDCDGNATGSYVSEPRVIANFKRINFKENIFEFVREEPLPKDADYLSDAEFIRLCENIHQFIPRKNDRTIHKKNNFRPGYYIIEYYNGDQLFDYHCIKLGNKGAAPKLWDALNFDKPVKVEHKFSDEKYVLILAECNTVVEAENFIKQKDPYPMVILPYKKKDGKILVGRMFNSKKSAEIEMKRLVNMGLDEKSMKIIPFK